MHISALVYIGLSPGKQRLHVHAVAIIGVASYGALRHVPILNFQLFNFLVTSAGPPRGAQSVHRTGAQGPRRGP